MSPDTAIKILKLGFSSQDLSRMHELAVKNQERRISPEEVKELDNYIQAGDLLASLQSKARAFLKKSKE